MTKLLEIDSTKIGTDIIRRFQSQWFVGRDSADFVMGSDGVMKCYDRGSKGFNFYPYEGEYEIVESKEEMKYQKL